MKRTALSLALLLSILLASCSPLRKQESLISNQSATDTLLVPDKPDKPDTSSTPQVPDQPDDQPDQPYTSNTVLVPDESSLTDFGFGAYARGLRLRDGSHLIAYEDGSGSLSVAKSTDDGKSWTRTRVILPYSVTGVNVYAYNAEIIELENGTLLCAGNYRPTQDGVEPYSIAINRSFDGGASWEGTRVIYKAGNTFNNGCWEPCPRQLPNGQVHIYFSDENPYRTTEEQEIALLWSDDNGQTWSETTRTVCFRKGKRDGMPVMAIFEDELVVTVEDNKTGEFKPSTVRCKIKDNWKTTVTADSPFRDYSLIEGMPSASYLGAPYIIKLPTGEALLSYQTNHGRQSNWERSCMEIALGDKNARNFKRLFRPFDIDINSFGLWNSVCVWNDSTILALTSSENHILTKKIHIRSAE